MTYRKGNEMTTAELNALEAQRTPCEVYSRIVGYIRPVQQWNDGKQAEYADRVEFTASCE
jgi:ribonucleoside-triphosphate reductase